MSENQYYAILKAIELFKDLRERLVSHDLNFKCPSCGRQGTINRTIQDHRPVYKCTGYRWDEGCEHILSENAVIEVLKKVS